MNWPAIVVKHRKQRQDIEVYKALIATPAVGPLGLPANGKIILVSVAGCPAGTTAATIGLHTIKTPLMAAGDAMVAGYFERAVQCSAVAGFEVYVDTGLGRRAKIGEGA